MSFANEKDLVVRSLRLILRRFASLLVTTSLLTACGDGATTLVVLHNRFPPSPSSTAPVVYRAAWQAIRFNDPVLPGASSDPQSTVAASANSAYVVLAPGWDPTSGTVPTAFVVLASRDGFDVHLNDTLHLPVDDSAFEGDCAAGSPLSQPRADFITQLVFPDVFGSVHYDAATCTISPIGSPGAH